MNGDNDTNSYKTNDKDRDKDKDKEKVQTKETTAVGALCWDSLRHNGQTCLRPKLGSRLTRCFVQRGLEGHHVLSLKGVGGLCLGNGSYFLCSEE